MKAYLNSELNWLSITQSETYHHPITLTNKEFEELMSIPYWELDKIKQKVYDIINNYNEREEDEWFNM